VRRVVLVVFLLLAALAPLGCAGADGQRAQELLEESDRALAQVETFRISGRMTMATPVGDFLLVMYGGGDAQPGGAFFITMKAPDLPEFPETTVVVRGEEAWMKLDGAWQPFPVPPTEATGIEQFDVAQYVKDVELDDDAEVNGEPAVKITGVIDTAGLFDRLLRQFGTVGGEPIPDLSEVLGDSRAVIYLSQESHLPLRMLLDMTMEVEGQDLEMHLDYAITNVDEPVEVPDPDA
jgi:outer membrane lipoprotein-sorting protein